MGPTVHCPLARGADADHRCACALGACNGVLLLYYLGGRPSCTVVPASRMLQIPAASAPIAIPMAASMPTPNLDDTEALGDHLLVMRVKHKLAVATMVA